jgi:hypothetical protein
MLRGEGDPGERVVLSRGDNCLREADVELLRGPHWLNDQLVTFYFTHLAEAQPDESALLLGGSVRTSPALRPSVLLSPHTLARRAGDVLPGQLRRGRCDSDHRSVERRQTVARLVRAE